MFIFDYRFCFVLPILIIFCLGDSLMPRSSFDPVKYFQHPHGSLGSLWPRFRERMAWGVRDHSWGAYACVSLKGFIPLISFLEAFAK